MDTTEQRLFQLVLTRHEANVLHAVADFAQDMFDLMDRDPEFIARIPNEEDRRLIALHFEIFTVTSANEDEGKAVGTFYDKLQALADEALKWYGEEHGLSNG